MKLSFVLLCAAGLLTTSLASAQNYSCATFTLPNVNGQAVQISTINGLNDAGQLIGNYLDSANARHGFLRDVDGTITYLQFPGATITSVGGINNLGEVDGTYVDPSGVTQIYLRHADGSYITVPLNPYWLKVSPPFYAILVVGGLNDHDQLVVMFSDPTMSDVYPPLYLVQDLEGNQIYYLYGPGYDGSADDPAQIPVGLNNNEEFLLTNFITRDVNYNNLIGPGGFFQNYWNFRYGGGISDRVIVGWSVDSTQDYSHYLAINSAISPPILYPSPALVCSNYPNTSTHLYSFNNSKVGAGVLVQAPGQNIGFVATLTGTVPNLKVSQATLPLGNLVIGETSKVATVYLTDTGTGPLHIPNFAYSMTHAGDPDQSTVSIHTDCSSTIQPGNTCSISLQYTPSANGRRQSGFDFVDDAPNGGRGISFPAWVGPSPLQISNLSWQFASHPVGQTSGNGKIYIYNQGPVADTTTGFSITGTNAGDFKVVATTCAASTLVAYRTCSVTFDFTPTAVGKRTAVLNINATAANGPFQVPIIGYGTAN